MSFLHFEKRLSRLGGIVISPELYIHDLAMILWILKWHLPEFSQGRVLFISRCLVWHSKPIESSWVISSLNYSVPNSIYCVILGLLPIWNGNTLYQQNNSPMNKCTSERRKYKTKMPLFRRNIFCTLALDQVIKSTPLFLFYLFYIDNFIILSVVLLTFDS